MTMTIRPLTDIDIGAIAQIEQLVMTDNWNDKALASVFVLSSVGGLGVFDNNRLVCYIIYQLSDVTEILRIGTHPNYQRQGYAKKLLAYFCELSTGERVLLEVRQDNTPAVNLYYALGFEIIHTRKNYYTNTDHTKCHALILQKTLQ